MGKDEVLCAYECNHTRIIKGSSDIWNDKLKLLYHKAHGVSRGKGNGTELQWHKE